PLKALQMEGNKPSGRSKIQWKIVCAVGAHYRMNTNEKLAFILAGAGYARVLQQWGASPEILNTDDADLKARFEMVSAMNHAELRKLVTAFWGRPLYAMLHWYIARGGWKITLENLVQRR